MRFSIQPPPGQPSAFDQWRDAMRAVCRLPMGIPTEFRKKVWLSLADHYLLQLRINWDKTLRFVFNERSNPDDDKLGIQIVKDLHRTGCSNFSGDDNVEDRAILKRVLLAYARWNKRVGYCQGFNVIAALLLNVMDRKEDDALKVMIYLIDSVLPESYFANNLRALSVDMAVFRDLLSLTYPRLSKHLDKLQLEAQDVRTGACYEPPLTNVFTMQWFLTLFATCLPVSVVLRVWDSVLLEGSEILLRTALTIWAKLSKRIQSVASADEFYSVMGELSSSIMQGTMMDGDSIIKAIYSLGNFPFPHVNELREKYTYNIRPLTPATSNGTKKVSGGRSLIKAMLYSDDDEMDDDDITAMACMPGEIGSSPSSSSSDISVLGPGVYGSGLDGGSKGGNSMQMERMSTDINSLKLQYQRLKERQQQAHIIIAAASQKKAQLISSSKKSSSSSSAAPSSSSGSSRGRSIRAMPSSILLPSIESPTAMNHLFVGKNNRPSASARNRLVTEGPRISQHMPSAHTSAVLSKQLQAVANAQAVSKSQRMRSTRSNLKGNNNPSTAPSASPNKQPPTAPPQDVTDTNTVSVTSVPTNNEITESADKEDSVSVSVESEEKKSLSCDKQSAPVSVTVKEPLAELDDGNVEDKCVQTSFEATETCVSDITSRGEEVVINRKQDDISSPTSSSSSCNQEASSVLLGFQSSCSQTPILPPPTHGDSITALAFVPDSTHHQVPYLEGDQCIQLPPLLECSEDSSTTTPLSCSLNNVLSLHPSSNSIPASESEPHSSPLSKTTRTNFTTASISSTSLLLIHSDSTPEDSGIDSSSTASPYATPGKKLQSLSAECLSDEVQSELLEESQRNRSDVEEVLCVRTSSFEDETQYTVSQSKDDNILSCPGKDIVEVSQGNYEEGIGENSNTSFESGSMSDVFEVVKSDDEKYAWEVDSCSVGASLPSCNDDSGSRSLTSSSSKLGDSNTKLASVLDITVATSPQRKYFHRSNSNNGGDSYVSSPSLIETVPIPENLDKESTTAQDYYVPSHQCVKESIVHTDSTVSKHTLEPPKMRKSSLSKQSCPSSSGKKNEKTRRTAVTKSHSTGATNSDMQSRRYSTPAPFIGLNTSDSALKTSMPAKPFNPFPVKLFNANRAKTGLKLGLYTATTLEQLKGLKPRTTST